MTHNKGNWKKTTYHLTQTVENKIIIWRRVLGRLSYEGIIYTIRTRCVASLGIVLYIDLAPGHFQAGIYNTNDIKFVWERIELIQGRNNSNIWDSVRHSSNVGSDPDVISPSRACISVNSAAFEYAFNTNRLSLSGFSRPLCTCGTPVRPLREVPELGTKTAWAFTKFYSARLRDNLELNFVQSKKKTVSSIRIFLTFISINQIHSLSPWRWLISGESLKKWILSIINRFFKFILN